MIEAVRQKLLERREVLARLQQRFAEARIELVSQLTGVKTHFAVDAVEISDYVLRRYNEGTFSFSLDDDPDETQLRHSLSLAHLFNSPSPRLYLLPQYAIEVWGFVRWQQGKFPTPSEFCRQALERLQELDAEYKQSLAAIVDKDGALSLDKVRDLVGLVKSEEFGPLCVAVGEFVQSKKYGETLQRLLETGKVSHRLELILDQYGIPLTDLRLPTPREVEAVFKQFPPKVREHNPEQKQADSRAILTLRNLNHLLKEKEENARVVLITRDQAILDAMNDLAGQVWFGWPDAPEHCHGIETIFVYLLMRGLPTVVEAGVNADGSSSRQAVQAMSAWLDEAADRLENRQQAILAVLERLAESQTHSERSGKTGRLSQRLLASRHTSPEAFADLAQAGEYVLAETSRLWDEHGKLQLSQALPQTPWVREEFLATAESEHEWLRQTGLAEFGASRRDYDLLRKLWEFLSTDSYRRLADREAASVWEEMNNQWFGLILHGVLSEENIALVIREVGQKLAPQTFARQITKSWNAVLMSPVRFSEQHFRKLIDDLQTWNPQQTQRLHDISREFNRVLAEGMIERKAENFLFLAYVFGLLNLWSVALEVAEESRKLLSHPGQSHFSLEIRYFIALARRRLAEADPDLAQAIQGYLLAFREIVPVVNARPSEARYLKEKGSIVLLYHEAKHRLGGVRPAEIEEEEEAQLGGVAHAKELLQRALQLAQDDRRLRLKTLNRLAYAEVWSDAPALEVAEAYLRRVVEEFKAAARNDAPDTPLGGWPNIRDTWVMVRAMRARAEGNTQALDACIRTLKAISPQHIVNVLEREVAEELKAQGRPLLRELQEADLAYIGELSEAERQVLANHIELLEHWRREAASGLFQ
ncbi:MAG TPA: hypothetical protein PLD20_14515 [Blastocatellia bacterium]|nr:hypothetical protein [Blastocatellia bacterium]HMX24809.1 hypothetical protein [Blastocatellia bacterium]HMZ19145.1 hypothetical protein [Blastocatellia bacterium]HNG30313.1 hypothetical protein [Blastocatellia bacterium]